MIRGYDNTVAVNNRIPVAYADVKTDDDNLHKSNILLMISKNTKKNSNKNIKDVLQSISPEKFIKLTTANAASSNKNTVVPFSADAIMDAFEDDEVEMTGSPGVLKGKVKMIEVEEPKSVQEIADCFTQIAELNGKYNMREYALLLFAGEKGVKFIIKKGNCLISRVKINPFIETSRGEKMICAGILAHTHPFGRVVPSKKDCEALLKFKNLFNQKFSVLAARHNWRLFDDKTSFIPPNVSLPLESLY